MGKAVRRNDPCPCGSGEKFKNCCLGKPPPQVRRKRAFWPILILLLGGGLGVYLGISKGLTAGLASGGAGLMIAGLVVVMRDPPPSSGSGDPGAINFGG